jgi:peptidoglycan-associated lipoprotein
MSRLLAAIAIAAAMALLTACANEPKVPEAHLGQPVYDPMRSNRGGVQRDGLAELGAETAFKSTGGDIVYFSSDSSELVPEARQSLSGQANWLQRYPGQAITIEGHADERGTREYNIALGAKRAEAVKSFLASLGVNPGRMRTVSFGKERPIAVCNDISCWSQNRRVQTILNAVALSGYQR